MPVRAITNFLPIDEHVNHIVGNEIKKLLDWIYEIELSKTGLLTGALLWLTEPTICHSQLDSAKLRQNIGVYKN